MRTAGREKRLQRRRKARAFVDEQNVAGSGRSEKLNGAISGSGNLIFRESLPGGTTFTSADLATSTFADATFTVRNRGNTDTTLAVKLLPRDSADERAAVRWMLADLRAEDAVADVLDAEGRQVADGLGSLLEHRLAAEDMIHHAPATGGGLIMQVIDGG